MQRQRRPNRRQPCDLYNFLTFSWIDFQISIKSLIVLYLSKSNWIIFLQSSLLTHSLITDAICPVNSQYMIQYIVLIFNIWCILCTYLIYDTIYCVNIQYWMHIVYIFNIWYNINCVNIQYLILYNIYIFNVCNTHSLWLEIFI